MARTVAALPEGTRITEYTDLDSPKILRVLRALPLTGLLLLSGCGTVGLIGDATDIRREHTLKHDVTLVTTRFNEGHPIGFIFGEHEIFASRLVTQTYTFRDRYVWPGDGFGAAAEDLKLRPLEKDACGTAEHALIFVHGYFALLHNSLDDAAEIAAELAPPSWDTFVLSWPSGEYIDDSTYKFSTFAANRTSKDLKRLLELLSSCYKPENITVLAHSKGGQIVLNLFLHPDADGSPLVRYGRLVLIAPDYSRSDFVAHRDVLAQNFGQVDLYISRIDNIVLLGSLVDLHPREALARFDATGPMENSPNIDVMVIDDNLEQDTLKQHSPHFHSEATKADIKALLAGDSTNRCDFSPKKPYYTLIDHQRQSCDLPIPNSDWAGVFVIVIDRIWNLIGF